MPDLNNITLVQYLEWLNRDTNFPLCEDLVHWAEYGITTALQLGEYLDSEFEANIA